MLPLPSFDPNSLVYEGKRFDVYTHLISGSKGNTVQREVVVHPGAVMILPLLNEHELVMIRNRRFAVGKELWELPAGTLEPNEEPFFTAERELIEETGYKAGNVEKLMTFFTTPGICNEVMYTFIATELTEVGQSLDESEQIVVEVIPWKKVLKMMQEGVIIDGKTIAGILYYHVFYKNGGR